MKNFFIKLLFFAGIVFNPMLAGAQDIIDISTQIISPVSANFNSFNTRPIVVVRNTTDRVAELTLLGAITGNGISITFTQSTSTPIILTGRQILQLSPIQLQNYFQENNVVVSGISKNELYRGRGLPPGDYQLCFQARSILNGALLSMDPPAGCGYFRIEDVMDQNAVRLTTQVIPPYTTYFNEYFDQNKVLVNLQNLTNNELEIRLAGSLEGENGITLRISDNFIPSTSIKLKPREFLQLSAATLKPYFDVNRAVLSGITLNELTRGNGLPEGNYQLCLRALEYRTGNPLSPEVPSGCAFFDIRQFEPPMIIQPSCQATVAALQPQNILFSCSVPAGVRPDQVEYVLKIVEMYPPGIDPNQAMLAANIPPLLEKVVSLNTYLYTLADPVLEVGKKYAFRVTARSRTSTGQIVAPINFRNEGHSEVCYFTYGKKQTVMVHQEWQIAYEGIQRITVSPSDVLIPPVPIPYPTTTTNQTDSPDCIADCNTPAPTNTSPLTIGPGDEVAIGKFTMTINTGNNTSGTGVIMVNFLRTPVNVRFDNLQVNTDYQVFGSSTVTAMPDGGIGQGHPVVTSPEPNPQLSGSSVREILQLANQNDRKVSLFPNDNTTAIGTPLSFDYGNFDLIVLGLIFTPTSTSANAIASLELMKSINTDDYLTLSTNICIRPNGFGQEGELLLMEQKTLPLSSNASMIFNQNTTRASFNCEGLDEVVLNGSLTFERDVLLPVNNEGNVLGGEVSANFNTSVSDFNNWIIDTGDLSSAFTIPQLVGFKFEASNMVFDHSSSQNTPGMSNAFPLGYLGANNSWTGLFIRNLEVTLPQSLKNGNAAISFSVADVLLDQNGFSGDIEPQTAILPVGKLGGWNFSIDHFSLNIEHSSLNSANMDGGIQLPITQNQLDYEVAIINSSSESEDVSFDFQVSTDQSVEVDMWFAELQLTNSTIEITPEGNSYRPIANLSGELTVNWAANSIKKPSNSSNTVSGINLPQLAFEHLIIEGGAQPTINIQYVDLDNFDNNQAVLAGFPINLNQFNVSQVGNEVALQLGLDLTLTPGGNGISAGTTFSILGNLSNGYYDYESTQLNSINIDTDVGVAHIYGSIDIYNQDLLYGDGFRGKIGAHIHSLNLGFDATMQIGKTMGDDSYRYWYFDLLFNLGPTGLPIPGTAAAIYSIGGGAYHNMYRDAMPQDMDFASFVDNPEYTETLGSSVYGDNIVPQQGSFGFNASLGFGLVGSPNALTGDVKFSMQVADNGAVDNVKIKGGGYLMQGLDGSKDDAFISGSLEMTIVPHDAAKPFPTPIFHMDTPDPFNMNVAGLLKASIPLAVHFDPQTWYVKLGEWQNWQEPWNDGARAEMEVDLKLYKTLFHGYFMMGNDIPELPPLPSIVQEKFGNAFTPTSQRNTVLGINNAGGGIAFGAGYKLEVGNPRLKFLIFYADIFFATGFDVTLKHYGNDTPCGAGFGINNWYAKGQMYALADFDVGMEVDVWFFEGKLSLVEGSAAATLQAALPNPNWIKGQFYINGRVLNGLIKVNTNFKFELGENCIPSSGSPFDDMPIIAEVNPFDGENQVSVFTDPEIAFNFPNTEFSVEEMKADGSTDVRTFYYTFESYKITFKNDKNTNETIDLNNWQRYRSDGRSAVFVSSEILPPKKIISYVIKVKGWEKLSGTDKLLATETKSGTFTTAQFPDYIAAEHFVSATPGYRQRYFLKNEWPKGNIKLKYDYSTLFDPKFWYEEQWKLGNYVNPATTGTFEWMIRYKELATNEIKERVCNISADGTRLSFNIPNGLSNEEIHTLDLKVRFQPTPNTLTANTQTGSNTYESYKDVLISGNGGSGGSGNINSLTFGQQSGNANTGTRPTQTVTQVSAKQGNQMVTQNLNGQQLLVGNYQAMEQVNPNNMVSSSYEGTNPMFEVAQGMGIVANPGGSERGVSIQRMNRKLLGSTESEKIVEQSLLKFRFAFKTSKYNTIDQKLNQTLSIYAIDVSSSMPIGEFSNGYPEGIVHTQTPVALLELKENFDYYQVFGYNWGNSIHGGFIEPIYKISYDNNESWLDTFEEQLTDMPDNDDWNGFTFFDEYGEHIIDFSPPFPNWNDYLPEYNDWEENRHNGKWPFGNRDYATISELSQDEPTFAIYNDDKHGFIDWKGKNVVMPDGALTNAEINQAASEAPEPPGSFSPIFEVAVYDPPTIPGSTTLYVESVKKYMAVIDYTEWLSMRDYHLFKKFIHDRNVDLLGSLNQYNAAHYNQYYGDYFLPISSYLDNEIYYKNRPGPLQISFRIKNREYIYQAPELNDN